MTTRWFCQLCPGCAMMARQPQMLQMFVVEKGQMSFSVTGQMYAVETGRMSIGGRWRCPVSIFYICLVSPQGPCSMGLSGPGGSCRSWQTDGNLKEPLLQPIWPDGPRRALTEDSMDPYRCTTKIQTHTGPRRPPTSLDGTQPDVNK